MSDGEHQRPKLPKRGGIGQSLLGGEPIKNSPDLERVLAIPRRERPVEGTPEAEELIDTVTRWFALPDHGRACACAGYKKPCIRRLRFIQAWALFELATERGLFGIIGTGFGKTALNFLAPLALPGCRHALLLAKPNLIGQLKKDYGLLSQHMRVPSIRVHGPEPMRCQQPPGPDGVDPPLLHLMSYNLLSGADATMFLERLKPDLVLSDEMQCLADMKSTRTRRFNRYMADADEAGVDPRFACWSGTPTDDTVMNYWHLLITALRENAPLPLDKAEAEEWARAIDPGVWPAPPGALNALCAPEEHIQEGYFRRLVETPGVVSTTAPSVDVRVEIRDRIPCTFEHPTKMEWETGEQVPAELLDIMDKVRETWMRPDGLKLFEDKLEQWRCLHQLACGFYLRWEFVNGETDEQIDTWVARRKCWNKEVREILEQNRPHMDSPELCARAAARFASGLDDLPEHPAWDAWSWEPWIEVADTVNPITVPVRVCDFVVRDAAKWALAGESGIIWYESVELGQWIAEISGLPLLDGGPTAGDRIDAEDGSRSIIASIRSHGTGRDGLQYKFARQLILQPFASSWGWEQLFGRLARVGQTRDVMTEVLAHTPELVNSLDKATERATYVQRTTGVRQALLAGG